MTKSLPGSIVKVKRATAARWTAVNPVLAAGELGYETDTKKLKLGDGTTSWTQLSYVAAENSGASDATVTIGTVTTLAAGSNATVTNSGSGQNVVLNFGIPRGSDGADGTNGADGSDGSDGQAATIRVGTVTTLAYTASATVVNSGTSTAAVLDFGIPRGKSVYEYAVEGGYEGTELAFSQLIEDLLSIGDGNEVEY